MWGCGGGGGVGGGEGEGCGGRWKKLWEGGGREVVRHDEGQANKRKRGRGPTAVITVTMVC